MFKNCKNTKAQGNIGMAEAIAYFVRLGHTVSIPLNDSQEYDLVVDIDNLLSKIQVKTTRAKTPYGIYTVQLRNTGGTSGTVNSRVCDSSNIDYLFVLTEENTKYLIPFVDVEHLTNSLNLGEKYTKFIVV